MIIAETLTFTVGRYRIQQRPRPDNPAWPVYIVFVGQKLIGKSFSMPNLDCCRWLEHWGDHYANESSPPRRHTYNCRNGHPKR
jgi:hypothetical protein